MPLDLVKGFRKIASCNSHLYALLLAARRGLEDVLGHFTDEGRFAVAAVAVDEN